MPTTYTHYRFGKDVLSALPKRVQQSIEANREIFDIGLHGPDILFYYKALFPNSVNRQGYDMHKRMADGFFLHGKEIIEQAEDKAAARAYMYGFICHFALDSECHPYIEKIIHTSGISHSEIEMEFDRYLMAEDRIPPTRNTRVDHIHAERKHAEVIAPFFEDVSPEKVKKALSGMILCHKALKAPNKGKRELIYGAMKLVGQYDAFHGLVVSEEPNPECERYCMILKKLYAGAVPLAADLIMKYQKTLIQGEDLPERFHRTFGAGDKWEDLPL